MDSIFQFVHLPGKIKSVGITMEVEQFHSNNSAYK